MNCPSEDTFALLLEGELSPTERHEVESHIDACSRCSELVVELGKVYGQSLRPRPTANEFAATAVAISPGAAQPSELVVLEGLAAATCLIVAAILWPAWRLFDRLGEGLSIVESVALVAIGWAPLGAVGALAISLASWRGASWARAAARVHAVLSLLSVVLGPLALYLLVALRSRRPETGFTSH